jgi:hypothetical protein
MHIGVGAALLILGVIYFMIISKGFRITVFVVGGLLAIGATASYYNTQREMAAQAEAKAKHDAEIAAKIAKECAEDKFEGKYADLIRKYMCRE